jgi:hypothetical protein
MPIPFFGGCACGAIRYACAAEPVMSLNCHCRDCQRASGSAYAPLLDVPVAAFSLTKGTLTYHRVTGESGQTVDRGFCPECGSPVLLKGQRASTLGLIVLWAASLDDPSWFHPTVDIFVGSAQPWDSMNPALRKFERVSTDEQARELRLRLCRAGHRH